MAIIPTGVAFAAEPVENIDYMNYEFPDDAKILYQSENGVIYQSKEVDSTINEPEKSTRSMVYESAWIDAGVHRLDRFNITNPHASIFGKTNGTLKLESNYSKAQVQILLIGGITVLANETITPEDGDVHIEFKSAAKDLVLQYSVLRASNQGGIRVMCWLW